MFERARYPLIGMTGGLITLYKDERSLQAGLDSCAAAASALNKEKISQPLDDLAIQELKVTAKNYWLTAMLDKAGMSGAIKAQMARLSKPVADCIALLERLPQEMHFCITIANPKDENNELVRPDLNALRTELEKLQGVCNSYIATKPSKLGSGANKVDRCCMRLWRLREYIMDRDFKRRFDLAPDEKVKPGMKTVNHFVGEDARFVEAVMIAIDPTLKVGTIQTSLRYLSKSMPWEKGAGPGANNPA